MATSYNSWSNSCKRTFLGLLVFLTGHAIGCCWSSLCLYIMIIICACFNHGLLLNNGYKLGVYFSMNVCVGKCEGVHGQEIMGLNWLHAKIFFDEWSTEIFIDRESRLPQIFWDIKCIINTAQCYKRFLMSSF